MQTRGLIMLNQKNYPFYFFTAFLAFQSIVCGQTEYTGTLKEKYQACQKSSGVEYHPEEDQCFCENGVVCENGRVCDSYTHACKECNTGDTRVCSNSETDTCIWGEWQNKECYTSTINNNPVNDPEFKQDANSLCDKCDNKVLTLCYEEQPQYYNCANDCKKNDSTPECLPFNQTNNVNEIGIKCDKDASNKTICIGDKNNANQYICNNRNNQGYQWELNQGCNNFGCNASQESCGCDPSLHPEYYNNKLRYCEKEINSFVFLECNNTIDEHICKNNYLFECSNNNWKELRQCPNDCNSNGTECN